MRGSSNSILPILPGKLKELSGYIFIFELTYPFKITYRNWIGHLIILIDIIGE